MKSKFRVKMQGTGIALDFECVAYELVGLPADTFWKIAYNDGTIQYINCFGLRTAIFEAIKP